MYNVLNDVKFMMHSVALGSNRGTGKPVGDMRVTWGD